MELTTEMKAALDTYAAQHGRNWRTQLSADWMTDHRRQWGMLRTIRNNCFAEALAYKPNPLAT